MHIISIIVACDNNGLIGNSNHLPWHIKEDLHHFRETTMGHPIIMGKKTWLSIGKPLDGRLNIILTHDSDIKIDGCLVYNNIESILSDFRNQEIFVIGGASIFKLFLPVVSTIYLTRINHSFIGDTYFPDVNWLEWNIASYEKITSETGYPISFEKWDRKQY